MILRYPRYSRWLLATPASWPFQRETAQRLHRGGSCPPRREGAFQLESGPIDYVARPVALLEARDIYAIYVEGTSMEPEHRPGDLRFVHPHKPARFGDSVIVQMQSEDMGPITATSSPAATAPSGGFQ